MQDVARLAGVSIKTVSNVLSGYEHVSAKMHDRVMAAVSELDYKINASARNLRVGRTRVIGLAVPELSQAYFAELADAIIRAASARGYTVLIEQTVAQGSDVGYTWWPLFDMYEWTYRHSTLPKADHLLTMGLYDLVEQEGGRLDRRRNPVAARFAEHASALQPTTSQA